MSPRAAILVVALGFALYLADLTLNDGVLLVWIVRGLIELMDWIAFWR